MVTLPIEFPVGPRTGRELRRIYDESLPFDFQGNLKSENELITLLASNSNYPNELETNAFVQAAAEDYGSPMLIQYSYTSTSMEGADITKMKLDKRFTEIRPTGLGAWFGNLLLHKYASFYGADMLFMTLDHFTSPNFNFDKAKESLESKLDTAEYGIAKTKMIRAYDVLKPTLGKEVEINGEIMERYIGYMLSPEYQSYRKDFLAAVQYGNPAWAMIDTGGLPIILNFATSKDIADAVRNELNNYDVMIEAEISATGQSGEEQEYKYWLEDPTGEGNVMTEEERSKEKALTFNFIDYVNADAIAYEIGMEHAAKSGVVHEPDEAKLKDIQWSLYKIRGRHIPFAQHGGTGSSKIIKGLVGKYNINTQYLYAGAKAELDRCKELEDQINGRVKKAIGTDRFLEEIAKVRETALSYLKSTGAYGLAPKLREILGAQAPVLRPYKAFEIKATE